MCKTSKRHLGAIVAGWSALLATVAPRDAHGAPDGRPVVAVFDIEPRGVQLPRATLEALSSYLAVQVGALPAFRCIPRDALHRRLREKKIASYRACYAQQCQIEIGQELAAQKVVSAQVLKLGTRCVLSLSLYDLRTATTDRVATAEGACDETGLGRAVDDAVPRLAPPLAVLAPAAVSAKPEQAKRVRHYSLRVTSTPGDAEIIVAGRSRGTTPATVDLPAGQPVDIELRKAGHQTQWRQVTLDGFQELEVTLPLSVQGRAQAMTATEWTSVGFGSAYTPLSDGAGIRTQIRFATLKWTRFVITLVDVGFTIFFGDMGLDQSDQGAMWQFDVSTRPGYPLYLGARGQHQIWSTLGLGYAGASETSFGETRDYGLFALSPGVDYVYHAARVFTFGVGVRAQLPLAGDFPAADRYPLQIIGVASMGFTALGGGTTTFMGVPVK